MINVRELRPGNLVLRWGAPIMICGTQVLDHTAIVLFWDGNTVDQFGCQEIHPIPLTPEWLEGCGFINKGNVTKVGYTNEWEGPDYFTIWQLNGHPHSYEYFGSEWTHGKSFEFVHQLQNLYFALTGEELQIKMP